jgi:hypothetical protein
MPHGDAEKAIWWNNQLVDLAGKINHRQYGYLTEKALRQASRIVDPFLLLVKTWVVVHVCIEQLSFCNPGLHLYAALVVK